MSGIAPSNPATLTNELMAVRDAERRAAAAELERNVRRALFGQHAKAIRQDRGISIREMAKRVGCSHTFLTDIERGIRWSDRAAEKIRLELLAPPAAVTTAEIRGLLSERNDHPEAP